MSEFDWAGLWIGTANAFKEYRPDRAGPAMEERDQAAASYLRERIEAAFVPVSAAKALMDEKHKQAAEAKLWFTKAQEWREIAARAEAAEAENAKLREALRELRSYGCPVCNGDCGSANPPVISCPMQSISAALRGEHDK